MQLRILKLKSALCHYIVENDHFIDWYSAKMRNHIGADVESRKDF